MKVYCKKCSKVQRTKKTKDKTKYAYIETYYCKKCGMRVFRTEEHRRKDLR